MRRLEIWIRTNVSIGDSFELSRASKDLNLTTRDVSNLLKGRDTLVKPAGNGCRRRVGQ
jgi:hypothetical protein